MHQKRVGEARRVRAWAAAKEIRIVPGVKGAKDEVRQVVQQCPGLGDGEEEFEIILSEDEEDSTAPSTSVAQGEPRHNEELEKGGGDAENMESGESEAGVSDQENEEIEGSSFLTGRTVPLPPTQQAGEIRETQRKEKLCRKLMNRIQATNRGEKTIIVVGGLTYEVFRRDRIIYVQFEGG